MADIKYYDVILSPVITEKSMNAMAEKKYTFYVHTDATKSQVADAVESMKTMNIAGKNKRRSYVTGKTAAKKKAVVQLTEDSADIEIFAGL